MLSVLLAVGCAGEGTSTSMSPSPSLSLSLSLSERYTDPAGWSFTYPAGMQVERSEVSFSVSVHEVTVANFSPRRAIRSRTTVKADSFTVDPPSPESGPFPSDGVAFRVYRLEGGPPVLRQDDMKTRFPLRLADFVPDPYLKHQRPRPLVKAISAAGLGYTLYAWMGSHASPRARAALAAVVASLDFPS